MGYRKLTPRKITYIINSRKRGFSIRQIAIDLKISSSTIKRVWKYYLDTGKKLIIKNGGRKMKENDPDYEKIMINTYMIHKMGARRLEKIIENDYGIHIPHNTIHRILLKNNLASEDEKKKRPRRKWILYERKHSISLVHMDWHTSEYNEKQVFIIMDD